MLNLTLVFKDIKLSSTKLQAHASLDDYPEKNICIGEGEEKKQHPNNSSRAWLCLLPFTEQYIYYTSPLRTQHPMDIPMLKAYQSVHIPFNGSYIPSTDAMITIIFPAKRFILVIILRSRNLGYIKKTQISRF